MHWAAPEYAWLVLLGVPGMALLRLAAVRRRQALRQLAGDGAALAPPRARLWRGAAFLLRASAFLLVVAALCRPQWGQTNAQRQSEGLDILIALDVSRSMLADDLLPTRLAVAEKAVARLLPRLQGDRVGLIAFAGSAFLVCPLTADYGAFAVALSETGTDTLPLGGSALVNALVEARRAFAQTGGGGKTLVVIGDGEDHGADLATATQALRDAGVTIYTVAAGTAAGGLIRLADGSFLKNRQGAIVRSRMQAEPLRYLAAATGGRYYDLLAEPQAMDDLYATALSGGTRRQTATARPEPVERYQLALALAVFLLLLEPLIAGRGKP